MATDYSYLLNTKTTTPPPDNTRGSFLGNFVKDLSSFATGIIPGIYNLGKTIGGDALHAVSLGSIGSEFKSDDLARAIGSYYKNDAAIGQLFQGNIGRAGQLAYQTPFSTLLDVGTVLTGGAGAAAKGAKLAATQGVVSGPAAAKAMRFAGYAPTTGLAGLSDDAALVKQATSVTLPSGQVFSPVTRTKISVPSSAGGKPQVIERSVSQNPWTRLTQQQVEKVRATLSDLLPEGAPLTNTRRADKHLLREADRARADEFARVAYDYENAVKNAYKRAESEFGERGLADVAGTLRMDATDPGTALVGYKRILSGEAARTARDTAKRFNKQVSLYKHRWGSDMPADVAAKMQHASDRAAFWNDKARIYNGLDDAAKESLKARIRTIEKNRPALDALYRSPELDTFAEQAQRISRLTEDEYFYYRGGHLLPADEQQTLRKSIAGHRAEEWRLLHPGTPPPEEVLSRAVFRNHIRADEALPSALRGLKQSHEKGGFAKHRTGKLFVEGRDRFDLRTPLDSYANIRTTNIHNRLFDDFASHFQPMTRKEFETWVEAGEDLVDISDEPMRYRQKMRATAETMRQLREVSPTVQKSGIADNAMMLDEAMESILKVRAGMDQSSDVVYAIPRRRWEVIKKNLDHSEQAWLRTFNKGTDYWRGLVLSARLPQWMMNNTLGQAVLMALGDAPVSSIRRLFQGKGRKALREETKRTAPRVVASGTGQVWLKGRHHDDTGRIMRLFDKGARFNQRWADEPVRQAAFIGRLDPAIRRLKKANPALDDVAAVRLIRAHAPELYDDAIRSVLGDLVDFSDLSRREIQTLRTVFPFYSWMKGATKASGRMLRDRPTRLNVLGQAGQQQMQQMDDEFGALPEYLRNAIPLPGGRVFTTTALNPVVTPADIAAGVGQFVPLAGVDFKPGPDSLISSMHPAVKMIAAGLTGTDPFWMSDLTGTPTLKGIVDRRQRNPGDFVTSQALRSVPMVVTAADVAQAARRLPYAGVYNKSWYGPLARYATGIPIRDINIPQANLRAAEEARPLE